MINMTRFSYISGTSLDITRDDIPQKHQLLLYILFIITVKQFMLIFMTLPRYNRSITLQEVVYKVTMCHVTFTVIT